MKRWVATISYLTANGITAVVHDIDELVELHLLVERGPDWRTIENIEVQLQRFDKKLTVEEANAL